MSTIRPEAPRSRTRKKQTPAYLAIAFFILACLYYLVRASNPCEGQTLALDLIMLLGGTATVCQALPYAPTTPADPTNRIDQAAPIVRAIRRLGRP